MKIDKVIKGFTYRYTAHLIPNTMTANVTYFSWDEPIECPITPDFKYIMLPDNCVKFISGYGDVRVKKLKMNYRQQYDAKDYNKNCNL